MKSKIITAREAVRLIRDGDCVVSAGFVGSAHPEALTSALEQRFVEEGHPRDLTVVFCAGQGDGKVKGTNHFGQEGMVRRAIGGHWGGDEIAAFIAGEADDARDAGQPDPGCAA